MFRMTKIYVGNLPFSATEPDVRDLFAFGYEDFTLEGYEPHPVLGHQ